MAEAVHVEGLHVGNAASMHLLETYVTTREAQLGLWGWEPGLELVLFPSDTLFEA